MTRETKDLFEHFFYSEHDCAPIYPSKYLYI